ncbi:MAG TPA: hypothetical protein VFO85_09755 [Vicinamibacteria bacterium]|nr:hypothetical protein [Vicinamibacteria bacterium]
MTTDPMTTAPIPAQARPTEVEEPRDDVLGMAYTARQLAALGPLVELLTLGHYTVAAVVEGGKTTWHFEPYGG